MSTLLEWKEQLQLFYGKYTSIIDKVLQFIFGLVVFWLINSNVGFMKTAASFFVTLGLALVCALLPLIVMTFLAAGLILLHFYTLSMPVAIVSAMIFAIMYIFYFRFSPGKAWLVLLTPVAFALHVPYAVPILFGLAGTPINIVPIACGTVAYYMLHYVKGASAALKSSGAEDLINSLLTFTKQVLQNPEMYVMIFAFAVCLILVYNIRTKSVDYAWKIAIAAGVIANIILVITGNLVFDVSTEYGALIIGSAAAAVLGICLEFFVFSVDYSRSQSMQFEDDEYYYYVKAVSKVMVSVPEKTVKRINERQDTASFQTDEIRKNSDRGGAAGREKKRSNGEWNQSRTEEELLKQSLDKELGIERRQRY